MNTQLQHAKEIYNPMTYKNFAGALSAFFSEECPQLGGSMTRQVLVRAITEMVHQFYPETSHMRPGQTIWTTIDKNEKPSYGKKTQDCKLTNVTLDLVKEDDAQQRAEGKKLRDIKKDGAVRLFQQSDQQDGTMTNAEVGILLKISASTVSKYVREYEKENDVVIPRRGTVHDMGPSITHKEMIVRKLFLEGKPTDQVCHETCHSPEAVHRYISGFKRVLLCYRNGLDHGQIAYAVGMSQRLVKDYTNLIEQFGSENTLLKEILKVEKEMS